MTKRQRRKRKMERARRAPARLARMTARHQISRMKIAVRCRMPLPPFGMAWWERDGHARPIYGQKIMRGILEKR